MKMIETQVQYLEGNLEAYTFKDSEFETPVNIAIFEDGSGIVIQDMFEPEDPREVVIDIADIDTLRTLLRYAKEKCKNKALAAQGDSND